MPKKTFFARTTPNAIRNAIQRTPEGPIVLWHFQSVKEHSHVDSLLRLFEECSGPGDGTLQIDGQPWAVVIRESTLSDNDDDTGGFVLLKKAVLKPATAITPKKGKKDYYKWWTERLVAKGLLSGERLARTPVRPTPKNDFEYDFEPDEDTPLPGAGHAAS